jgi:hypothetical protein
MVYNMEKLSDNISDKIMRNAINHIASSINESLNPIDVIKVLYKKNLLCKTEVIKTQLRVDFSLKLKTKKIKKIDIYYELSEKYCLSPATIRAYTLDL